MPRKTRSAAAAARRFEGRYLTDVMEGGAIVGWRFNPGPGLRAAGVASRLLKRADGLWLTWEDAKAHRDALVAGAALPPALQPPRAARTLHDLWEHYLASPAFLGPEGHDDYLRPPTQRMYRSMIKPWLAWAGAEPVAALSRQLIRNEYLAQKQARTHASAHASLRSLMALLSFGVREEWIPHNPALRLKLEAPPGRLRFGTDAECAALVDAADALRLPSVGDAIVAALWTAQRQTDLLACDLGRQLTADGANLSFGQSKTGRALRVRIMPPLAQRLAGRRSGFLTAAPDGGPWQPRWFRERFAEIRAHAALTTPSVADLQFRDLRDTSITRLAEADVPIKDIALWSGHSLKTIEHMLDKHYLGVTAEARERSADQLDAWRKRRKVKW